MARNGKLNAMKIKALTKPGRYGDGDGLWLQVRTPTNRSWIFRYMRDGKARWLGLGEEATVSLAQARDAALQARKSLAAGVDPIEAKRAAAEARRAAAEAGKTFSEVVTLFLSSHEVSWRNAKHRAQWRSTLATYAESVIGKMRIGDIKTDDILAVLRPIWTSKTETASRVRGRVESVLDFATAHGWRTAAENPARWRGHLSKLLPPPARIAKVEHHAAAPWQDVPTLMIKLAESKGTAAACLRFGILTAARSGEARGAQWSEIDLDAGTWIVPGDRMKTGEEHRVPLSSAAASILRAAWPPDAEEQSAKGLVFPGGKAGRPLSDVALNKALATAGGAEFTVHGMRSTFRDWTAENTQHPRELAEASLAHANPNKVEAAYRRSDLLEKRRQLMQNWSDHCTGKAAGVAQKPQTQQ